jgi:hypothetical protein
VRIRTPRRNAVRVTLPCHDLDILLDIRKISP